MLNDLLKIIKHLGFYSLVIPLLSCQMNPFVSTVKEILPTNTYNGPCALKEAAFFLVPCILCPFKRDWIFSLLYFCFSLSSEAREAKCYAVHFVKVIFMIKRFVGYQVKSKFVLFLFDQMEVDRRSFDRGSISTFKLPACFDWPIKSTCHSGQSANDPLFCCLENKNKKNLWKILDQKI